MNKIDIEWKQYAHYIKSLFIWLIYTDHVLSVVFHSFFSPLFECCANKFCLIVWASSSDLQYIISWIILLICRTNFSRLVYDRECKVLKSRTNLKESFNIVFAEVIKVSTADVITAAVAATAFWYIRGWNADWTRNSNENP